MNCQDISRLIDLRGFGSLTDAERRDADAHARSCAHCLPLWSAHVHVVAMPVPATPPELAMRWRTPAAAVAPTAVKSIAPRRRMIVVASLVALAAAAGMLLVDIADAPAPQLPSAIGAAPAAIPVALAREIPAPQPAVPAAEEAPPVAETQQRRVPRIPPPVDSDKALVARGDQALRKLVELYPELVQGPPTEDGFAAAIALRANGDVLSHAMQLATRETTRKVSAELGMRMPTDGGEPAVGSAGKGMQLPDGRVMRGNLWFTYLTFPTSYDPSRSNLRVEEILRARAATPMFPESSAGVNYLTVLLSADGAVLREDLDFVGKQQMQQRIQAGTAERAQDMARRLGIAVDQIGLMGFTRMSDAANGRMYIDYAWQRRAGESAPAYRQADAAAIEDGIEPGRALALVEQLMPEAFVPAEPSMGLSLVVLTQEGEVIRTGRLKLGTDSARQMQELVPGLVTQSARTVTLKNSKGEEATVYFVWQASRARQEEIEKARKAAPAR